jgi:Iap family predicted aminopeptidase
MPRSVHPVALIALALAPWLTTACDPAEPSGMQADMNADLLAAAVRTHISAASLEPHARAIVEHERLSGSEGENAAIDYVVATLEAAGVPVEVHAFEVYASDPVSASVSVPDGPAFPAITSSFSASVRSLRAPLVDLGPLANLPAVEVGTGERIVLEGEGIGGSASRSLPDVSGAIVLVDGQPRNLPVIVLDQLGAAGVIFANTEERVNDLIVTSTWGTPSLLNYHRLPDLPVAHIARSAGEQLRALLAAGPLEVALSAETDTGWKELRLAVARIPGPDPASPYVLFGGHIDGWYHAATDEGASNAAMLDLALAFHAERERLRRGLVVAWWPGHSTARYGGSTWFADHFFEELRARAVAHVNVDGIGQMGARLFAAATTASLAELARFTMQRGEDADIQPTRPGRNSDQSFNGVGLPLLQLYRNRAEEDGGYWWWHTPEDTFDKIDFDILAGDTNLYAIALSALLGREVLPLDVVGQVEMLGAAIAARSEAGGGRFDLSRASEAQAELLALAGRLQGALPRATGSPSLDMALVDVLRPLHRVLYVPQTPHHPDAGAVPGLLPGLAPTATLAEETPGSDRHRLAMATLVRERNRLLEAIAESNRRAAALLASLE